MSGKADRIAAVVGSLLVAVMTLLVMASCRGSEGVDRTQGETTGLTNVSGTSEDVVSDMTIEEFKALIDESDGPTGENVRDAATSPNVPDASAVYQEAARRGFDGVGVTTDFDIKGNHSEPQVLESNSSEKCPSYVLFYQSTQGVTWVLYVNDGIWHAVPTGSDDGALSKEVIVVEGDVVVQYDGTRNEFSDRLASEIADASVVRVTSVDKATLDSYGVEELEAI